MFTIAEYILLISTLILLGYHVTIFSRLVFYKPPKSNESTPKVSIIVAAHNEGLHLPELLKVLIDQDYPNYDIWIALDRPKDGSEEIMKNINDPDNKINWFTISDIPADYHPKKYALEMAVNASDAEYILFTDADCRPASLQWVTEMVKPSRFYEVILGYSPYFKKRNLLNLFIRFETFYTGVFYLSSTLFRKPYMAVGRNFLVKKSLFITTGGYGSYKDITGGDDDLFINQLPEGTPVGISISKSSFVYSYAETSIKTYLKQKIRHLSVGKYYLPENKLWTANYYGALVLFYVTFWIIFSKYEVNDYVITLVSLRFLALFIIFAIVGRRLRESTLSFVFPFFEVVYSIYLIALGLVSRVSKNIRWK